MFLQGMKKDLSLLVAIDNPDTLLAAITRAKAIEAGRFYSKEKPEERNETDKKINDLTKQFEQMVLNQVNILAALEEEPSKIVKRTYKEK
jgi:hypothetical protein